MVIREFVWDVCVYISCTGDKGQLGSSFLRNGRGGWGSNFSMFVLNMCLPTYSKY